MTMADSGYQSRVLKHLAALMAKEDSKGESKDEGTVAGAKELLFALAGLAGKGKDELVQSICREIGQATAAVLKEPLAQLLKDRKLQVTIEFVPVKNKHAEPSFPASNKKKPRSRRQ